MPLFERASNIQIYGGTFNDVYGDPAIIERMKGFLEDSEREEILAWVSPMDVSSKHFDVANRRQPGTGQWLLNMGAFKRWEYDKGQALWCSGIPGAGKTVLASLIIDHLNALRSREPNGLIGVACVYYNYKERSTVTLDAIHRSLIRQLAVMSNKVYARLKAAYEEERKQLHGSSPRKWVPDLRTLLQEFGNVYIVVDALDECAENNQDAVLEFMAGLQSSGANVLVTSRDHLYEIIMHSKLADLQRINIRGATEDIARYVEARLDEPKRLTRVIGTRPSLRTEIVTAITNSCQGMFLMATLHIAALESQLNVGDIVTMLKVLPKSVPDIYDDAMSRIENSQNRPQALRALSFLIYACRPLTVPELQQFLALRPDDSDFHAEFVTDGDILVAICAGLVVIDTKTKIIRLVHFTAQEYFDAIRTTKFREGNLEMAHMCLTYLSFSVFKDIEDLQHRLQHYTLLRYITKHWHVHVHAHQATLREQLLAFLNDDLLLQAYSFFKRIYDWQYFDLFPQSGNVRGHIGLHIASATGLLLVAEWLLQQDHNANSRDSMQRTPLLYACQGRHADMVKFLIGHGARVDTCYTRSGESAVHFAARHGAVDIMHLLLGSGAAAINAVKHDGETALHTASLFGHEAVVRLLVESGADVNAASRLGKTALHTASRRGHEAVVRFLLESGANVNVQCKSGETPLHIASRRGRKAIVPLLLESGAAIDTVTTFWHRTALHIASEFNHAAVVRLLVESGAALYAVSRLDETALHAASRRGHEAIVRFLLESGTNVNVRCKSGETALHIASKQGCEAIVRLLLEKGAVVDMKNKAGATALHVAKAKGHETVVEVLLENGADVLTAAASPCMAITPAAPPSTDINPATPPPKKHDRQATKLKWWPRRRH